MKSAVAEWLYNRRSSNDKLTLYGRPSQRHAFHRTPAATRFSTRLGRGTRPALLGLEQSTRTDALGGSAQYCVVRRRQVADSSPSSTWTLALVDVILLLTLMSVSSEICLRAAPHICRCTESKLHGIMMTVFVQLNSAVLLLSIGLQWSY